MILDSDKKLLKRYRHIIAALIAYSIGYFTPLAALRAIQDYKNNQPNFCEFYLDIAWKRGVKDDKDFLDINRHIIKGSIKYRQLVMNLSAQVGFNRYFKGLSSPDSPFCLSMEVNAYG